MPQLWKPACPTAHVPQQEKPLEGEVCAPLTTTTEKPVQQRRPSTVKNNKVIEKKGNADLKHDEIITLYLSKRPF